MRQGDNGAARAWRTLLPFPEAASIIRMSVSRTRMKPISRRAMLSKASLVGTTFAAGLPLVATSAESVSSTTTPSPKPKVKVIVAGGHPGDPEYGCGGTIARYTDLGHEVVLLYLNRGEWPENPQLEDAKSMRIAEARRACEILKARPAYAGQINGAAVIDADHYEKFHRLLEAEQPTVVFTQWPLDNHADHRAISMLVYEAWLRMGKKFALYYYEVSNGEDTVQFTPTHYVEYFTHRAAKTGRLLRSRQPVPGPVLRPSGAGHPDARNRERP